MSYVTVFEFGHSFHPWSVPAYGFIFIAAATVFILVGRWRPARSWDEKLFGWPMLIFAVFWTLIASTTTFVGYWRLSRVYQQEAYKIVEGRVENFDPIGGSKKSECFTVSGERFCYSDFWSSATFNEIASRGGPIREGIAVRIAHHDGAILRLEVQADSVIPKAERSARAKAEDQRIRRDLEQMAEKMPFFKPMSLGFAFAMTLVALYWNYDWRHYVEYWMGRPPPFRPVVTWGFRAAFLAFFLIPADQLITVIGQYRYSATELGLALVAGLAALVIALFQDRSGRAKVRERRAAANADAG